MITWSEDSRGEKLGQLVQTAELDTEVILGRLDKRAEKEKECRLEIFERLYVFNLKLDENKEMNRKIGKQIE